MALCGLQFFFAGGLALAVAGGVIAAERESVPAPDSSLDQSAAPPTELALDATSAAIRDLVGDIASSDVLDKEHAGAVTEFYAGRNYAAAWITDRAMTDSARALIARIKAADIDGLDPSAFRLPNRGTYASTPQAAARADVLLSQAVAAYAQAAYAGQVDPSSISRNIGYERKALDLPAALTAVAASPDPVETLAAFNPPHREFVALRDKLAALRQAKPADRPIEVPSGPTLKLGSEDARVGFLRQRLDLPTDVASPALYDESVATTVKTFQRSAGLHADGIVGPRTLAALNADPVDPIPSILVNMEKWRWMPRDLGRLYVRVNIPDFTLDVYKGDASIHTTRIVVGKPTQQTPIFSDEIEHAVVNPAWNVPASITRNEMLPAARRNPGALRGYEVFALVKGRYRAVDPRRLNWRRIDARKIQIRQPPGRGNALGKVKFMFPNRYSVYLHDTPAKSLFEKGYRAYSHGCVRVMNPMAFAEALLSDEPELSAAYLESLYGSRERRVDLTRKVPVHITYFTTWIDESGTLQFRDDLYGHDRRIEERLVGTL